MRRRLLAVLSALVLSVSVMVVGGGIAGSPVGAANTATEALFDGDEDAATPSVRQFAGANRFLTSVALAKQYADSGVSVDTVIVASGEAAADAAAAAGLAGVRSAPVLLTAPDRLTSAVEKFIDEEFITKVYIIGGTAQVSQAVEDDLNAIETVNTVTRLAGLNRYETSVEIATEMEAPDTYCDTDRTTVLLINTDKSFADVIAAGPLAYAQEVPILLTRSNSLPDVVANYLSSQNIEQVIVIGGTAAVPSGVVAELGNAGVTNVTRVSGANRFATAVALRNAIDECPTVSLSPNTVALVNATSAADGVASAPLLGEGLVSDDGVTPLLFVTTNTVPTDTLNYLATYPITADGIYVDLAITAIGGTAAVSDEVVQAAIAAAITSAPLTAIIEAKVGTSVVTVTFSAPVNDESNKALAAFATSVLNKKNYDAGGPLFADDTVAYNVTGRRLTITLDDQTLAAGDVISLKGGAISGAISTVDKIADNRRVQGVDFTVAEPVIDNTNPRLQIIATEGAHEFAVQIDEPNDKPGERILPSEITWKGAALPATAQAYYQQQAAGVSRITPEVTVVCLNGVQNEEYVWRHPGINTDKKNLVNQFVDTCLTAPATGTALTLTAGDTISVATGAVVDVNDNANRLTNTRVASNNEHPSLVAATVSTPVPTPTAAGSSVSASATWTLSNPVQGTLINTDGPLHTTQERARNGIHSPSRFDVYLKPGRSDILRDIIHEGDFCARESTNSAGVTSYSYVGYADGFGVESNIVTSAEKKAPSFEVVSSRISASYDTYRNNFMYSEYVVTENNGDALPGARAQTVFIGFEYFNCANYLRAGYTSGAPGFRLNVVTKRNIVGPETVANTKKAVEAAAGAPVYPISSYPSLGQVSELTTTLSDTQINRNYLGNVDAKNAGTAQEGTSPWEGTGGAAANFNIVAHVPDTNISIIAKADGDASGASGNEWFISWFDQGTNADVDTRPDVTIKVLSDRKTAEILFDDGATVLDVLEAARDHAEFSRFFTISAATESALARNGAALSAIADTRAGQAMRTQLSGGRSQVTLTLRYNDVINSFDTNTFATVNSRNSGLFSRVRDWSHSSRLSIRDLPQGSRNAQATSNEGRSPFDYDSSDAADLSKIEPAGTSYPFFAREESLLLCPYDDSLSGVAFRVQTRPNHIELNRNINGYANNSTSGALPNVTSTEDCRTDDRYINMTRSIVYTISATNLASLPQAGDRITLPNGIATSYRYDSAGTQATTNDDGSTTLFGATRPVVRTLRRG